MSSIKFAFQFSFLMAFFSIVSYYFFSNITYLLFFFFLSALFLIGGMLNLRFISLFEVYWVKLALILGKVVSPLLIGIIYFGIVFPTKLFKLIFIDFKRKNSYKNQSSYWNDSKGFKTNFKNMH